MPFKGLISFNTIHSLIIVFFRMAKHCRRIDPVQPAVHPTETLALVPPAAEASVGRDDDPVHCLPAD